MMVDCLDQALSSDHIARILHDRNGRENLVNNGNNNKSDDNLKQSSLFTSNNQ